MDDIINHIQDFMNQPSFARRIQRVRHELLRHEVRVRDIQAISPGFLAITFTGESLSAFVSLSFDDHVKLILTDSAGLTHRRDFTPLRFKPESNELTLEFALHEAGAACQWARQAKVGDPAVIGGPRGSMVIPTDYAWHLLAGDASALPAIQRRLEEFPEGTHARVLVHLPLSQDERNFRSKADLQLQWLATSEGLVNAIRQLQFPPGEGFVWCAGEATSMAQIRDILLLDKQLARDTVRVSAYWKSGAADFHEAKEQ